MNNVAKSEVELYAHSLVTITGRDEQTRNARYVEANSQLFQGIPQSPVRTSLTYDTGNTGWYFIVAIYETTVPLPGARFRAIHISTTAISGHAALVG